ncbi:fungal-specific transcription factor domain-containing protein [Hypoxylon cercidicola]|nr:fungal-specific transcription factor domain-containing protein [Hypoxylon cercidicola]
MKHRKDCWTCKARRVPCDGGSPACQKCARARRVCQGYGVRLSWPRNDDKRRATTGVSPPVALSPSQMVRHSFINTTWRDMELYHHLNLRTRPLHLVQTSPKLYRQPHIGANDMELVKHFHDSAHLSLVTFDINTSQIRDTLIRMALADDTVLGLALFHALAAFSSLHRSGLNEQAMQLKISALHFLSASAEGPLTSAEAAQHVATSMLLGAFDILLPSASSGEWLWYTQGAMDIVQATCLETQSCESYFGHLLDWVYFHDTLSRFPMHHWQHGSLTREAPDTNYCSPRGVRYPALARHRPALPPPNPSYAILNLLSEACDTLLDPRDPTSRSEEYHDRLSVLERRIENVHITPPSANLDADAALAVEVFQTATRVYLVRASQSPWEMPASLDSLIDKAFAGPIVNCTCPHFFPLFILACEARTDDRRRAILDLIDSTENDIRVRNRAWLKEVIQSVWVHQDLHADSDLLVNYVDVMSEMISSSDTVPSFV